MEQNSTYDQEIDLKDLMFAVLYKWRPVVIAAVVIGILLGGFKAFSTYKSQNDPTVIAEKEVIIRKIWRFMRRINRPAREKLTIC